MTIALLGATGMVGGFVLEQALEQGYQVRALARTPQKLEAFKDRIAIIKGDARDPKALEALLNGSDVVVSTLGPVKADGDAAKMISTTASGHIVKLMPEYGIERYIVVSGAAVVMPGDNRNFTGWLMRTMVLISLGHTLTDKQAEYELLAASDVQWTLLRCPLIDPEPFRQKPVASLETPGSFNLRAGELAHFLIQQIESEQYVRQGPFLNSQ